MMKKGLQRMIVNWSSSSRIPSFKRLSLSLSATPLLVVTNLTRRNLVTGTNVGAPLRKKMTTIDLQKKRVAGVPISMCTAYTYPSAVHVSEAGIDVLLVGDSLAMVELGHDTTLPVSVDQMLYHCKAVVRGANTPLLVGDMPFGSYESDPQEAYRNAVRFLKEGEMDCVKLEGGTERAATVKHLVDGGIAVMGHIGLTPQRISVLGGFRAQGKSLEAAKSLIRDAIELERAGAFALVIECVPSIVAKAITKAVRIPTIGIGSGPHCNGQVLVYHDLLGFYLHAHHAKVAPMFCKQYARVGQIIQQALEEYRKEVEAGEFPGNHFSPYKMTETDTDKVAQALDEYIGQVTVAKTSFTNTVHKSDKDDVTIQVY